MKLSLLNFFKRRHLTIAFAFAIGGVIYYLWQSLGYAHTLSTIVWDESMYLYKGFLFASGRYQPFQDYGPWTSHPPLAFLVPGYVQAWFGPGMGTGRYFAVFLGVASLVGTWIAANRLAGRWWAAAAVWAVALNPTWVKIMSQTFSQGLVNFFFVWMLVLVVGKTPKLWELSLGAILAAFAGMTRINVLPALFIYLIYVFWQFGKDTGLKVALAGILPVVVIHALYWPEILKLWAYWIPPGLFPSIGDFRSPWREVFVPPDFSWWPLTAWITDRTHLVWKAIQSFDVGIRSNFLPAIGVLAALLLWPRRADWKSGYRFRLSVFLVAQYLILLLVHVWAALGGHTCGFVCFSGYFAFFNLFGLLAIVATFSSWKPVLPPWRQFLVVLLILIVGAGLNPNWLIKALEAPFPRVKDLRILPGESILWVLLENKFHWDYNNFKIGYFENLASIRWLDGVFLVIILSLLALLLIKNLKSTRAHYGSFVVKIGLVFALILSPVSSLGGRMFFARCDDDVIASHEQVGSQLNSVIPPGSLVYWDVKANMLLLYLPGVETFTPQLNHIFTQVRTGEKLDLDLLYRFNWWNNELGEQWIQQADYILVENRFFGKAWQPRVENGELEVIFTSSPAESCRGDDSRIVVLQKTSPPLSPE